ncbi:MAG: hypothetical protein KGJ13_12835, partial [Patescibacteria group bacterium]|nr:hypothetical protein [Patescibacteria group bacterium]
MARKPVETAVNDAELLLEEFETPADQDEATFEQRILSELQAAPEDTQWAVQVSKMNLNDKGAVTPQGYIILRLDISEIGTIYDRCREFGTGVYRIEVRKNNRIWKRSDMRIMVPEKTNATAPSDLSAVIVAAVNAANAKTHSLLEKMLEKSLTTAAPQPAFNPVEMFAGIG